MLLVRGLQFRGRGEGLMYELLFKHKRHCIFLKLVSIVAYLNPIKAIEIKCKSHCILV